MTTNFSAMSLFLLALTILALTSSTSSSTSVHAFAPLPTHTTLQQQQQSRHRPTNSNTRLFESIVEAEDRFLEQVKNGNLQELPDVIYTIVYNPNTPEEGIHTMKYPRGSDEDVLLCFEGMADCIVFARTIKEDPALDQEPNPTPTSREMMEGACKGMGMKMEIVPMETKTEW